VPGTVIRKLSKAFGPRQVGIRMGKGDRQRTPHRAKKGRAFLETES